MQERFRRHCYRANTLHPPTHAPSSPPNAKPHTFVGVGWKVAVQNGLHAELCRGVQRSLHANYRDHCILPQVKPSQYKETKDAAGRVQEWDSRPRRYKTGV